MGEQARDHGRPRVEVLEPHQRSAARVDEIRRGVLDLVGDVSGLVTYFEAQRDCDRQDVRGERMLLRRHRRRCGQIPRKEREELKPSRVLTKPDGSH